MPERRLESRSPYWGLQRRASTRASVVSAVTLTHRVVHGDGVAGAAKGAGNEVRRERALGRGARMRAAKLLIRLMSHPLGGTSHAAIAVLTAGEGEGRRPCPRRRGRECDWRAIFGSVLRVRCRVRVVPSRGRGRRRGRGRLGEGARTDGALALGPPVEACGNGSAELHAVGVGIAVAGCACGRRHDAARVTRPRPAERPNEASGAARLHAFPARAVAAAPPFGRALETARSPPPRAGGAPPLPPHAQPDLPRTRARRRPRTRLTRWDQPPSARARLDSRGEARGGGRGGVGRGVGGGRQPGARARARSWTSPDPGHAPSNYSGMRRTYPVIGSYPAIHARRPVFPPVRGARARRGPLPLRPRNFSLKSWESPRRCAPGAVLATRRGGAQQDGENVYVYLNPNVRNTVFGVERAKP